jgi:hypothetical protein
LNDPVRLKWASNPPPGPQRTPTRSTEAEAARVPQKGIFVIAITARRAA